MLEAKDLPVKAGADAGATDPYVYQAVGQGYFFDDIRMGTHLVSHKTRGITFLIVTQESMEDVEALKDALFAGNQK